MTFIGGTIYGKTILLDTTDNVEYQFLVDSSYINEDKVPQACGVPNGFGGYNRFLSVPENDTTIKEVCYSSCAPCVPFGLVNVTFRVDMKNAPLGPGGPHLVGAFNNWNPTATPLNNLGNNIYGITLPLDTTKVYSYRFLSENSYNNTEVVPAICGIADSLGVFNRFIDVPEFSTILRIAHRLCYYG